MQITITIPDAKLTEFAANFLEAAPIPVALTGLPLYTKETWLRVWIQSALVRTALRGARRHAASQVTIDPDAVAAT